MEEALSDFKKGNYGAAIQELNALGEAGNMSAQIMLGALYNKGGAIPHDDKMAAVWFEKAANQGNAEAQYQLGNLYENSQLPRDYKVAANWYQKAAQSGSAKAQARLGVFYTEGFGVTKNLNEALLWSGKAALQGNADAQLWIGSMYGLGKAVPRNDKLAMGWLTKAAAQGEPDALLLLANMYKEGEGGPKDPILAYALNKSAITNKTHMVDKAKKMRDKLTDELTSDQLNTSNALATELQKPNNFSPALNAYITKYHKAPFRFFDRPEK
jgi:TPR repeat protein